MNRHIRTLLSASRNLVSPVYRFGIIRVVVLLFFCFVAAYYIYPRAQSFTIVASTQSVSVTLSGGSLHLWSLENAVLCLRLPKDVSITPNVSPQTHCDPGFYREIKSKKVDILWTPGHRLTVSGYDKSQLTVEIETFESTESTKFGKLSIVDKSVLFFGRSSFDNLGGLVAHGQVKIGEIAEAGAAKLTRGGTYQIRENMGIPSRKSVVASGEILTGDFLRLTDGEGNGIDTTMFLTRTTNNLADFDVIMTSPERPSAIEITRIGGAQSTITTRWTERIINDALPVALSIFLGLFGASLGIVRSLSPRPREESQVKDDKQGKG